MAETAEPAGAGPLRERAAAGLVAVLAAVPYARAAFRNGFVYDDFRFILHNPHVTAPQSWLRMLFDPVTVDPASPSGIVRPLRTVAFAIDYALCGDSAVAFHLSSLFWHVLAAVLCFFLLRRLLGGTAAAAFGAALWAVHPLQTESVAWISSRGDVAMGACTLGSLLLALRSRGADRWLAASLGVGLAAMLFKETAIVLPLLVVLVRLSEGRRRPREALAGAWPWLVLAVAYFTYRHFVKVGEYAHAERFALGGSAAGTFATMFRGFGVYVTQSLVPARPAIDWFLPVSTSLAEPAALLWLALHAAILATGLRAVRRAPLLAAGIGLFYVPLIPVANWPFNLGIPTAERFLYLPLVGGALLAALAFRRARSRAPATAWVGLAAVLGLAVQSGVRTGDWATRDTLWGTALETHETPRGSQHAAGRLIDEARAVRKRRSEILRAGGDREEVLELTRTNRRKLESALRHSHAAIDLWHRIERMSWSQSDVLIVPENNAAHACTVLKEYPHALFHAERALEISGASGTAKVPEQALYNRAVALIGLGRGVAGLRALEELREHGMELPPAEWMLLATDAGQACSLDDSYAWALRAYERAAAWGRGDDNFATRRLRTYRNMVSLRRERLRSEYLAGGDQGRAEAYALFLARNGEVDAADAVVADVVGKLTRPVAWVRARHEARGTEQGWRAAIAAYAPLATGRSEALYRRGRCHDEVGEGEQAADAYRRAIEASRAAGEEAPWVEVARRFLARYEPGCPERRDHGIR